MASFDDAEAVESGNLHRRLIGGRRVDNDNAAGEEASVEQAFLEKPLPSWREQLTVRAFVVGFLLSILFSVIIMKLSLSTDIIPSLNVSASLLAFFLVRLWTKAIEGMGLLKQPFTRQENTVIQTCVVATYGLSFSGKISNPRAFYLSFCFWALFVGQISRSRKLHYPFQTLLFLYWIMIPFFMYSDDTINIHPDQWPINCIDP
jgi:ABC-type iron transport system FetAB permease component